MNGDTWPYYIDDPLVDLAGHKLTLHIDHLATAQRGRTLMFGQCSCAEWCSATYDDHAVLEAYDHHMQLVQVTAHQQHEETP